jgi:hypothetical protein
MYPTPSYPALPYPNPKHTAAEPTQPNPRHRIAQRLLPLYPCPFTPAPLPLPLYPAPASRSLPPIGMRWRRCWGSPAASPHASRTQFFSPTNRTHAYVPKPASGQLSLLTHADSSAPMPTPKCRRVKRVPECLTHSLHDARSAHPRPAYPRSPHSPPQHQMQNAKRTQENTRWHRPSPAKPS